MCLLEWKACAPNIDINNTLGVYNSTGQYGVFFNITANNNYYSTGNDSYYYLALIPYKCNLSMNSDNIIIKYGLFYQLLALISPFLFSYI